MIKLVPFNECYKEKMSLCYNLQQLKDMTNFGQETIIKVSLLFSFQIINRLIEWNIKIIYN